MRRAVALALLAACEPVPAPCTVTEYRDEDRDGWGDDETMRVRCEPADGWVGAAGDCDDHDGETHPGADEVCDGRDQNCDGVHDGDLQRDLWLDRDGDGAGDPDTFERSCWTSPAWVTNDTDCDDLDPAVHPGATDDCGDAVDTDCDPGTC